MHDFALFLIADVKKYAINETKSSIYEILKVWTPPKVCKVRRIWYKNIICWSDKISLQYYLLLLEKFKKICISNCAEYKYIP